MYELYAQLIKPLRCEIDKLSLRQSWSLWCVVWLFCLLITSSCFEFLAKKHYWLLRIASWALFVLILSKGTKNSNISRCCKGFGASSWKGSSSYKSSNILLDQFMRVRVAVRVSHALVVLLQSPCVIDKQIVPTNC